MSQRAGWTEVRCGSSSCDRAARGGRVLFEHRGGLVAKYVDGGKLICVGMPIVAQCKCGAIWTAPDVALFDGIGELVRTAAADGAEVGRSRLIA